MANDEVKVEQCDRDLAADIFVGLDDEKYRDGTLDKCNTIQTIARHRLAARPAPAEDAVERVARAMQAVSRPDVDPDQLTPGSRGSVGLMPVWRLYEHMARAALAAMQPRGEQQAGREEER